MQFTFTMTDVWATANPVIGELTPVLAAVVGIGLALMVVRAVKSLF